MAAEGALTRHDLEAKIVKRCWEDEEFRKEFVGDPAGAFVKYMGANRGNLPKIVIHEESAGSWHIVLPAKPANVSELSDEELEQVAGGITPTILITVTMAATASLAASATASASAAITMKKGW